MVARVGLVRRRVRTVPGSRSWWARAAIAVIALATLVAPASGATAADADSPTNPHAPSGTAAAPHAASKHSADVNVYASNQGVLTPPADLFASVVITNTGSEALAAGTVAVSITQTPFTERTALRNWLALKGDSPATRQLATTATSFIAPGTSIAVQVTVPAAEIGISQGSTAVFGLTATLSTGTDAIAKGNGSLVWNTGTGYTSSGLAVAMPLTAPATADGLIAADDLATYTSDTGVLTRELDGIAQHPTVAIGLDPMILASIRVLGTDAPASAVAWLRQLSALGNDIFPLQYADADVAGQVQSGLTELLQPISFNYAVDTGKQDGGPTVGETAPPQTPSTAAPGATPTPTAATNMPTMQQLLSWPYTLSDIAWPPDNSVQSADLPVFAKNGLTTTILSGDNTNAATLGSTPNAVLPVPGGRALVSHASVSAALRAATGAVTDAEWGSAMASLNAQLAMIDEQGADDQVILATLGRTGPTSWPRMSQTFTSLTSMPWVTPASLREAIASPTTAGLAVKDMPESDARIASIKGLIGRESGPGSSGGSLTSFATVLDDPTALTGPARNQLLSLLGATWLGEQNDWPAAVSASLSASGKILDSVQIVPPGKVSQLSNEVLIPITVSNSFHLPVNIVMHTTPSNGRLEIDDDVSKTVPAGASAKLLVPVKAKVGNGKVQLTMELFSPTGVKIGATQKATVEVHAEWEGLGALIIGIIAVLLLGFGIVRSIRRRRRASADDGEPHPHQDPDADSDAGAAQETGPGQDADADSGADPESVGSAQTQPETDERG